MLSGIRQGCPLSPLLFVLVVDILLRTINKVAPEVLTRAFADDIGAVVPDWELRLPCLQRVFKEFANVSGLDLNISKTICIPLWHEGLRNLNVCINTRGRNGQSLELKIAACT